MKVMNIGIIIRNDHNHTFPVALTPQMVSVIQNLLTQIPVLNSKLVDGTGKKIAANASIPIIPREMEFDWDLAYSPMMPDEEKKLMQALNDKYEEDEKNKPAESETDASDVAKTGGIIVPEGMGKDEEEDPEKKVTPLFSDKDNPFNMSLKGEGRANVDLEEGASDKEPNPDADDKVTIGSDKAEQIADEAETAGAEPTAEEVDEAETASEEADKIDESEASDTTEASKAVEAGKELDKQTGDCTVEPVNLELKGGQNDIGG